MLLPIPGRKTGNSTSPRWPPAIALRSMAVRRVMTRPVVKKEKSAAVSDESLTLKEKIGGTKK